MKRPRSIFIICLIALCMLMNCYLLICNVFIRMKLADSLSSKEGTYPEKLEFVHSLKTINDLYENGGTRLKEVTIKELDTRHSTNLKGVLDSIGDNAVALICRFSQFDCEQCVSYAIERALSFANKNNINLLIWGNYDSDKNLKIIRDSYVLRNNAIWYNVPELSMPIEQHGNPYYMVITGNGTVVDMFTPDKMDPKMTDLYFDLIENKWESEKQKWI